MIKITKRTMCQLCDSPELELGCHIHGTPVAEKYGATREEARCVPDSPLDLYRCRDCGHVQLLDLVDAGFLFDEHYTYRSGQTEAIIRHFQEYAKEAWEKWGLQRGDLVVEIGSNDGTLLKEFQKLGAKVLGVDPASTIATEAVAAGVETIVAFFDEKVAAKIKASHGEAKLVVANNVFAHSDNLQTIAAGVSDLLRADGVFMFEVSYLQDVLEKCLLGTIFHEHFSYHAVTPLDRFMRRNAMEIVDVKRVGIQGGSIIVSAKKAGAPYAVDKGVAAILRAESESQLNTLGRLQDFERMLRKLCDETKAFVEKAKNEGKTFGGFGAARSGTTLIAQLGIADDIDFILDNHPDKVGRFSAGYGIEVLPVSSLAERPVDYLFVFAWVHAKNIIAANPGFAAGGGKWITCVPKLEVTG
jgi:SAM-dependent methyltransferase